MAKSSKDTRSSAAKARSRSSASKAAKPAAAPKKAPVRSAPKAKVAASKAMRRVVVLKPRGAVAKPSARAVKARVSPVQAAAISSKPAPVVRKLPSPSAMAPALSTLRADERSAVLQALSGKATLLQASPRARDAIIFSTAALASQAPVVVASPLAAELFAQATATATVDVIALGSFVDKGSRAGSWRRIQRGGALLVVVDPASLSSEELQRAFAKAPLGLVGVAAAHACSEHAHELSPAYLSLRDSLAAFAAPVLATCTLTTQRVVEQVVEAIGGQVLSARAPEITQLAEVVRPMERKNALIAAILRYGAPGVVLTATSQEADSVLSELTARRVACVRVHSGMAAQERSAALARFVDPREQLVLVTQSPHANASGLAGCAEASHGLESVPPRDDLRFVVHYQAPLSPEQLFEDSAWLPDGAASLVLADSSDAALVQAILAQQRIKPTAIEAMAHALAQLSEDRPAFADTLALRAGTSRRSAERVLSAFADRNLIVRDAGHVSRKASAEGLAAEGRLLASRFAALRAADTARAESVARYVTSRHGTAVAASAETARSVTS
jgi:hypothetical protein